MARPKPWISRLPLIKQTLRDSGQDSFSRRDVELLFSIQRSAAGELMNVVGLTAAVEAGEQGFVSAGKLLDYLTYGPEAQAAEQDARRRHNLAVKLNEAGEEQKLRSVRLNVTAADEWAKLNELPNVSIENGALRIAFSSAEELVTDLYRLAKAAGNDLDAFARMCGEGENQQVKSRPALSAEELDEILRPATPEEIERILELAPSIPASGSA